MSSCSEGEPTGRLPRSARRRSLQRVATASLRCRDPLRPRRVAIALLRPPPQGQARPLRQRRTPATAAHYGDAMTALPLIDVAPLLDPAATADARRAVGARLDRACRTSGFLLVTGHGVERSLRDDLERHARAFFALPDAVKAQIAMPRAGAAWRGWFPVGGELTAGEPDLKEGIYFGTELGADDPRVRAGVPLHGANLFPAEPAELRRTVLRWIEQVADVGQALLGGIALGLGIEEDWFARHLTADPTVLFRAFHYPPGGTDGLGRRRAHRLRPHHAARAGPPRRSAGARRRRVDRRPRRPVRLRRQPRRHARPHDARPLSLRPAPGAQPLGTGPRVLPPVPRPVVGRARDSAARLGVRR